MDLAGNLCRVKISDIVAVPLGVGSAIRQRRVFHPIGVLATGTLHRVAPEGEGLPVSSSDVVVRVSKALGTPGGVPDLTGLAVRMPPLHADDPPWDLLMATTGGGRLGRLILRPATAWQSATMTTLMPLAHAGKYYWLRARMRTDLAASGLSLEAVKDRIRTGGVVFDIDQAANAGDFRPVARLEISGLVADGTDIAFDPTRNGPADVKLAPGWVTDFRRAAYRRSRQGRDA